MTPDDKRESAPPGANETSSGSQAPKASDEGSATGLAELAGGLPSVPPAEGGGDDDADLKALAALAAQRPSVQEGAPVDRAPRVQTAPLVAPPAPRAGGWFAPMLIGIVIGAAGATVVFKTLGSTPPQSGGPPAAALAAPRPAAEPEQPAPAPAVTSAAAAPALVAATPEPSQPAPAAPAPTAGPAPATAAAAPQPKERAAAKPTSGAPVAAAAPEPASDDDEPLLEVEPPPPPPPGTLPEGTARAMDDLLDDALSPTARKQELARRQAAALAPPQLPLTPSGEDAKKAMTVLLPAIRGCAMGQSGLATANMVVRADGRVASVEVTGAPFAGSASGRCMEGVIRRARFSPFRQPTMRIKFPLAIQ